MPSPKTQRDFALEILQRLREAGYDALFAGGCVRDQFLGFEPKDYDVATSARPEQIQELFGRRRTLAIGAAFGVIAVLTARGREPIEVATFRSDGAYVDGRRPSSIEFTTAEQDARRRDFTINGLFLDPLTEEVIDYVDGQADLHQQLIRAIGDAHARFAEDKLRMLRAVRIATTLGFTIEARTLEAIRDMADQVTMVSAERIGTELRRLLVHPARASGVERLHESGLLQPLLPEVDRLVTADHDRWLETLAVLRQMETANLPTVLAGLLVELDDAKQAESICGRFRFTNKEVAQVGWLLRNLPTVHAAHTTPWPRLQRILVAEDSHELLVLGKALYGADHPGIVECQQKLSEPVERLNPPLLVTGDDLVAHGIEPGRHFRELLDYLRDEQLEGRLHSRGDALKAAEEWIRRHG